MRLRIATLLPFLLLPVIPGSVAAQDAPAPAASAIATDRPGFLFSSLTVGRGVVQAELGLPAVTLYDGTDARITSLIGLLRVGVGDDFELRLGGPVYNEIRVEAGGQSLSERGYGDLEAGLKWHVLDNAGARPSFALIPSVIVPTGEDGFSVEDPVYQLNTATEWTLADGWGVGLLAGFLRGEASDGHYLQQTYGALLGRTVGS
ncbi:MAG: transporter, partial [Acidobacteriota bacterium]